MTEPLNVSALLANMISDLRDLMQARDLSDPKLIGIRTGGVWIANRIRDELNIPHEVGELDISFYRDDFTQIGLNPTVSPSSLPFATENENIILIDDVLMTGRTVRAAMNEIFDYGRPASITFLSLIDLGKKELPISADIVGKVLTLESGERIKLQGPEELTLKIEAN